MGGDFALMMAPRRGVSAASVNYGGFTEDLENALPDVRPVVASYGARHRWLDHAVSPIASSGMLTGAGVEHDASLYPEAGHGFLNHHDPAELPVWVKAIAKLAAAEYHEPSARDARRPISAFLRTPLGRQASRPCV